MSTRTGLVLLGYVLLMAGLVTGIYDPLTTGRDDSWAIAVMLGCAHLGLGVGLDRREVLLCFLAFAFGLFVLGTATSGAPDVAIAFWALIAWFVLTGITALGLLVARLSRERAVPVDGRVLRYPDRECEGVKRRLQAALG